MFRHVCTLLALILCPLAARAREATGADLLYRVGDEAAKEAFEASRQEEMDTAHLWRQWATRYWNQGDQIRNRDIPIEQLLNGNIAFNRRAAQQAADAGNERAARFYDQSARFWNDIGQQLAAGQKPEIHFPRREMLSPIAGLPGTPWENMGRDGGGNNRGGAAPGNNRGAAAVADPIPRPNYHWLHGQRYTETAMGELVGWYRRQKYMSREEQDRQIAEARKRNEDDERSEKEWIQMTVGPLGGGKK